MTNKNKQIGLATLLLSAVLLSVPLKAQVTIGDQTAPDVNAVLDLRSNTKLGLLLPRLPLQATNLAAPLSAHVAGMVVYNTITAGDVTPGFYYDDIHFRALIVPDKSVLHHEQFNQTHDDFYYKMYFDLLKVIFSPSNRYNIYIDIKDTRSQHKVEKLTEVLRTSRYDFDKKIITRIQQIRSHEVELLPLSDLLIGANLSLRREKKKK